MQHLVTMELPKPRSLTGAEHCQNDMVISRQPLLGRLEGDGVAISSS